LLKSCAGSLCEPIAKIFNKSLETGTCPHRWKTSNITALYKKRDPQNKSNYRPISLLSNTSKIVERILFERLYRFLTEHNLLSKNSGFKRGDGTMNQLVNIVENIYQGFEDDQETAMVFLDVIRAFDRVWHNGLLYKL